MDKASKTNLPFAVIRVVSLLLLALPGVASAAWPLDEEWTRRIEAKGLTRFVHHGVERADESVQPAAWLVSESLQFGTWANFPLNDTRSHELALAAAYTRWFENGTAVEFAVTHYHLRDARAGHPGHTAELSLTLSRSIGPGRVEATYLRDVKRQADLGEVAYAGEWALKSLGAFLNYRAYLGAKAAADALPNLPGPKVADSYTYFGADLTVPYRIGGATIVTVGVHYAGTKGARPFWSPIAAPVQAKLWATLAATYEF